MSEPNIFTQEIKKNLEIDKNLNKNTDKLLLENNIFNNENSYIYKAKNKDDTLVVKIAEIKDGNILEVKILNNTNNIIKKNISPHFPYKYYSKSFTNYIDVNLSTIFTNITRIELPTTLNDKFLIYSYEFFDGNFENYIQTIISEKENEKIKNKFILNALLQIFISILSYHSLGYLHNDCHTRNFIYKNVNADGYIKYNIYGNILYLENLGFIWAILDYEDTKLMISENMILINKRYKINYNKYMYDYLLLYNILCKEYNSIINLSNNKTLTDIYNYLNCVNNCNCVGEYYEKLIFTYMEQFFDTPPEGSEIINEVPYIVPFNYEMEMDGGGKKQKYNKTNIIKNINGKNKTIYLKENCGKTQYVKHNSQYIKLTEYRKK